MPRSSSPMIRGQNVREYTSSVAYGDAFPSKRKAS